MHPRRNIFVIMQCAACILYCHTASAQNSIVLNGGFIALNGGTVANPIYVVVNQGATTGISRVSGHIISESQYNYVRWLTTSTGNYTIPFGYSTTNYLPFIVNKTSAAAATLTASTYGTSVTAKDNLPWAGATNGVSAVTNMNRGASNASITSVIDRWWDFYSSGLTANLTFTYLAAENTISSPTGLSVQRWTGTAWNTPVVASLGTNAVTVNSVSSFSPFIVVRSDQPLPVTIINFNSLCSNKGIQLVWSTSSEHNSDYFTIEASETGADFKFLTTLAAAGNSETLKNYAFMDYPQHNKMYYRLKETDLDGTYSYYKTIHADCEFTDEETVDIYPNPASDILNYRIFLLNNGAVSMEIYDQAGRTLMRDAIDADQGITNASTDISSLTNGFYYIKIYYGHKTSLIKFIKIK